MRARPNRLLLSAGGLAIPRILVLAGAAWLLGYGVGHAAIFGTDATHAHEGHDGIRTSCRTAAPPSAHPDTHSSTDTSTPTERTHHDTVHAAGR